MKIINIYTDGSSRGNPGPGGFGVILQFGAQVKELSQGFRRTTNNRMELATVISKCTHVGQSRRIHGQFKTNLGLNKNS